MGKLGEKEKKKGRKKNKPFTDWKLGQMLVFWNCWQGEEKPKEAQKARKKSLGKDNEG